MATCYPPLPTSINVTFESRPDGGLRAYSDELPGFVLSNRNPDVVVGAVEEVLEVMLSEIMGCAVRVERLVSVSDARAHHIPLPSVERPSNYVGIPAAA